MGRLRTDSTTRSRLGPALLAELQANLWAIDCQTCNQPLGGRRPALTVAECDGVAEAAVHHRRCQRPRWESADRLPRYGWYQSWRSGGFAVRGEGLVVLLVNPSCEVARLVTTDRGWRLANLDGYLHAGMEPGWPQRQTTLPGLTGSLRDGTLTVDFELNGAPLGRWSTGSLPDHAATEIRRRDAVLVGVTTAVDVTTETDPELVESLVATRRIALAWASVRPDAPLGPDVRPAVLAAVQGDGSLLAALRGPDRFYGVLEVAGFAGLAPRSVGRPDGAHIVVPDEPTGQRLEEMGRPLLEMLGISLVRPPGPGADVVIGTPEQFAAGPGTGAHLAVVLDVAAGALPPDFPGRYERVLTV